MRYNFDELIDRENTNSVKYDGRERAFGKKNILPLWIADMDFKTPDFITNAVQQRAKHEIYGYTLRPDSYQEAIKNWLRDRHCWNIETEWLQFSPGVVPALALSVMCFSNPGDSVIVQPPVYFPFYSAVKNTDRKLINNPLILKNGRYYMDLDDLKKKIKADTRILMLSNPHNPGGMSWTKEELQQLGEICLSNNILVISDEIHSDLIYKGHKHIPFASISDDFAQNSFTCMAPSKTFNIAGLSTSFLVIPNKKTYDSYNKMMEGTHLYGGNLFGAVALEAAYTKGADWLEQMMDYIEENFRYIKQYLNNNLPQIVPMQPEATYLVWLDFSYYKLTDTELNDRLIKAGVGMNRGVQFGKQGTGFMRMNIACPRTVIAQALEQIKKEFGA